MTDLSQFDGVWRWTPQEHNQGLLPLLKPLNFSEFDCRISLQIGENEGLFPSVVLGGSQWNKKLFPDYKGYLVGFDSIEQLYVVKKEGDLVHAVAGAFPADNNKHSIEIAKRQDQLLLWVDHTLVMSYRDPDMNDNQEGYIYLYSNATGKRKITLESLQLSVFSHKRRSAMPINRCVLQNGLETTVEFTQLIDSRIARIYNSFYYVFVLHDVSFFTRNIKSLEKEKEKAFLERNKFKALAMQGGAEREEMLGVSPKLISIKENAKIAAASSVTILIEGKTGTGKEVLAHYIHRHSLNSEGPFVKVDCSSLPGSLLESELFGFEKGAFTGADHSRKGKLEEAEDGTLFLDEIGNLSANAQVKLLNFLQDFTLERIGSNKKIKIHTRIIAAANQPLQQMVDEERFRKDLYYRLNVVEIYIPPLRQRKEDLELLIDHIMKRLCREMGLPRPRISADILETLKDYHWPGNVRELRNVLERALILSQGQTISVAHFPGLELHGRTVASDPSSEGTLDSLENIHIRKVLSECDKDTKKASTILGISRASLYRKLNKAKEAD